MKYIYEKVYAIKNWFDSNGTQPGWFDSGLTDDDDNGYAHFKELTQNHLDVSGGADLSDFDALYSVIDADLKTVANGGYVESAVGHDIRFETLSGTKLDHDLVFYDGTVGALIVRIKIPTLTYASDLVIRIYFGKASQTTPEANPAGTYNSAYKFVSHLSDDPSVGVQYDGAVISTDSSDTQSVAIADYPNRMLLVAFGTHQGGGPSGVTYGGVSMTKIVEQVGSFSEQVSIWGLLSPAVGTANVAVSGVGSYRGFSVHRLYNCRQVLPTGADIAVATGASAGPSLSITPTVEGSLIIDSVTGEDALTMTTSGGVSDAIQTALSYENIGSSHFVQGAAAAKTMSYSMPSGQRWNIVAVAIKPAAQVNESTGNGYDLTSGGLMTSGDLITGPIHKAIEFDGTDDGLVNDAWASVIDENDSFTMSIWFNITTTPNVQFLAWGEAGASNLCSIGIYGNNIGFLGYANDHIVSAAPYDDGAWHKISVTFNGTTVKVLIDGTEVLSEGMTLGTNPGQALYIGRWKDGGYAPAKLAEPTVSNVTRTNGWEITHYNAESDNASFWTTGPLDGGSSVTDIAVSDNGAGSDALSLLNMISASDTGTSADALAILVLLAISEGGVGTDTASILAFIDSNDNGTGSDSLSVLNVLATTVDGGTGSEAIDILRMIPISDTGAASDLLSILAFLTVSDSGSGTDTPSILNILAAIADSGIGSEEISSVNSFLVDDAGTGSETLALLIMAVINETGSGAEAIQILADLAVSDTGVGSDTIAILKILAVVQDTGTGTDALSLLNTLTVLDAATGADLISVIVEQNILDAGSLSENMTVQIVSDPINISDAAAGTDALSIERMIFVSDSGAGADQVDSAVVIVRYAGPIRNGYPSTMALREAVRAFTLSGKNAEFVIRDPKRGFVIRESKKSFTVTL